jgi:eukaryotic-like serine/threonine-protein kinase
VRGEAIDRRVDIFALGIVLYALTTGKHPFRRENEAATMYTIASTDAVVSPRKFLPDYPASLETVLLKSLAKNPADRYATASEFLRALDQCLPASERANTDEDVGVFIGKLFSKKREESRAALAEALALADRQGPRGTGPNGTGPHSALTQSQVSSLSTVGVAASLIPESTFTSVGAPERAVAQRRKRLLLFSLSGVLLVACVAALALRKSGASGADRAAPATQLSAPVAKPSETADTAQTGEPSAPKVDLQALPVESSTAEVPSAPTPNPVRGGWGAAAHPLSASTGAAATSASAKGAAKTPAAPKWRQDPGF